MKLIFKKKFLNVLFWLAIISVIIGGSIALYPTIKKMVVRQVVTSVKKEIVTEVKKVDEDAIIDTIATKAAKATYKIQILKEKYKEKLDSLKAQKEATNEQTNTTN